jgi:hypothetical protein
VPTDAADQPPAAQRPQSPYDSDARWSSKNDGEITWVGSKAHLTETCDDDRPHLITDVHTASATDPDTTATAQIADRLEHRGLTPATHLMDSGYPTAHALATAAARGTTVIAPITRPGRNAAAGTFTPADFTIDWDRPTPTATCPNGALSISANTEGRGLVSFGFSRKNCTPCPIRTRCLTAQPPQARRIAVHPQPLHQARTAAIAAEGTEDWHRHYRKRAGIEGTISQAVRGPNLRHARYRGLAKTHVQNTASALAININRLGAHYAARQPKPRLNREPHPPPVHHPRHHHRNLTNQFASRIAGRAVSSHDARPRS